jgi:hypothetical protein
VTNVQGAVSMFTSFNFVNSTSFNVAELDFGNPNGIESEASPINLTALGNGSVLNVNAPITVEGFGSFPGNVTLAADDISVNKIINSEFFGIVTFEQEGTSGRSIDLGGGSTPGDLGLSDAELGRVVAKVVRIGRADSPGNITVTAPLASHSGFPTLSLISGGSISDVASSDTIAARNLAVEAGAGISLDTKAPMLAFSNSSGAVRIANTGPLMIDSVDGVDASSNSGTTTTLSAASPMTFAVNTTSAGTLTVTTAETASETGTPLPTPDDNITVNGGITLQSTSGDVNLQSADGIDLHGQVLAPAGSITLSIGVGDVDHDGSMAQNGALSAAGTLTFNIPTGDSAALSGTAVASQATENGGGSLFVDGSLDSPIAVNAGTLAGQGIVSGAVNVQPGATLGTGHNRPGILATGTATLLNPSTFSAQLSGTTPGNSPTNYGQLEVNGDMNLNQATLAAALTFAPTTTQTFTLIQASGNINGQFAQGSKIILNGITYAINYLPHSVVLAQPADLSVSVNGPASVDEGSAASYTYNISNGGPGAAPDAVLSAPIPAGAVFVSASFGGGLTLPASAYDPTTGIVDLGMLPPSAGGTLTLNVKLPEENPGITFAATITTIGTADFNLTNNTASVTTLVNDAPLTAQSRAVSTTHGAKSFTNVTVATFSDANLAAALSDFTATVNWGDGTIIAAQIVANSDGTFSVIASHTYKNAKTKSYSLAIQILDVGGSEANLTGTANLLP